MPDMSHMAGACVPAKNKLFMAEVVVVRRPDTYDTPTKVDDRETYGVIALSREKAIDILAEYLENNKKIVFDLGNAVITAWEA